MNDAGDTTSQPDPTEAHTAPVWGQPLVEPEHAAPAAPEWHGASEPTAQFPTLPLAEHPPTVPVPTVPVPTVPAAAPASSVVLSTNAPTKQRKSVLPWAVAGVLGIAAAAFAVLWVGKSGDADDLGKERDALVADKGTLEADLVTANSSLESAQSDLAAASADLAAAEREQSDLEAQVADLETESGDLRDEVAALQEQVAQLESEAGGSDISDATARRLGEALGQNATPPLTTAEAQCFGREMINNVGVELMIEIGFSSNPTDNQLARLGAGLIEAAFACDIELSRLNL